MSRAFTSLFVLALMVSASLTTPVLAEDTAFGGVGLQVVPTINGDLVVLNVLSQAPAAKEGMLPGDLIFKVDDYSLQGSDFGKVVSEHLWGPVGSPVTLFYRRPGLAGERSVILKRSVMDPRLTVTPTVNDTSSVSGKGQ